MTIDDITILYSFEASDYDEHYNVAFFLDEEAAIQFGVKNLLANHGRHTANVELYDLCIHPAFDSLKSYNDRNEDVLFDYEEKKLEEMRAEMARRIKKLTGEKK